MKDLTTHSSISLKEGASPVGEKIEIYYRLLNEATEQFNKKLETIEKRCLDPRENPDALLSDLTKTLEEMNDVCEQFEQGVDQDRNRDAIKEARIKFREKTDPLLSKSSSIKRARSWPQGYQGDFKTLEIIYRNTPQSERIGCYADRYCLNLILAQAVRNRIKKLGDILREEISARERPSVLNIACGSCRELMGLSAEIINSKARVICIDSDQDAVDFAQSRLHHTGALSQLEFRKYNAIRMFDHELNMMEFGMQDIIYSVGFFDYLHDDFLVKMLRSLYMLLNPGGKLIMTFKDADYYKSQAYHWLFNWDGFLQRRGEDFKRLLHRAEIPDSVLSMSRDKSGIILFYTATK